MQYWQVLLRRIRHVFERGKFDQELQEEMKFHLEEKERELIAAGMAPEEAKFAASRHFGNATLLREQSGEAAGFSVDAVLQDLRYGARLVRRNPVFATTVIIVLAIGIGANAAMFSLINSVLLRPLPYKDSDRLVFAYNTVPSRGWFDSVSSPLDVTEMRKHNRTLERLAGFYTRPRSLTGGGEPEQVETMIVSPEFFEVFQAAPLLGRTFVADEEHWGNHRVVVLAEGIWKRRYAADPNLVGRAIQLNGEPHTVVGIMPARFWFESRDVQLWVPMAFAPDDNSNTHNNFFVSMVGRLKPDASAEAATADLDVIMKRIAEAAPEISGMGAAVRPMHEAMVGDVRRGLMVLFGAVGCVLLIACANIGNLQLARAADRAREMAVRNAIGASRGRLVRQFMAESMLLSFIGGIAGLALAYGMVKVLMVIAPSDFPRLDELKLDGMVLAFTFGACVFAGLLFAIAPALYFQGSNLSDALRDSSRNSERRSNRRLRSALVVSEVAMALVLLIGAGLMIRSLLELRRVNAGVDAENVLTMELLLPRAKYGIPELEKTWAPQGNVKRVAFFEELVQRVETLPGVHDAGAVSGLPLSGDSWGKQVTLLDRPEPTKADDVPMVQYGAVAGDYFRALRIPLVKGRMFNKGDNLDSTPVVLVNQEFVRRHFGDGEPLGKTLKLTAPIQFMPQNSFPEGYVDPIYTIVGVVGDVRYEAMADPAEPTVYGWYSQGREIASQMFVTVRTDGDPFAYVPLIREQLRQIDPDRPISEITTMEQLAAASIAEPRLQAILLGSFSGMALLLATVGIYGLISYSVAQRRQEIGIRIALGAAARQVLGLLVAQGVRLALLGLGIGIAAALLLTRAMTNLLFGVKATDPLVFVGISALLAGTAVLASYIPARRALKVDPMVSLRHE